MLSVFWWWSTSFTYLDTRVCWAGIVGFAIWLSSNGLVSLQVENLVAGSTTEAALVPYLVQTIKLFGDIYCLAALTTLWV